MTHKQCSSATWGGYRTSISKTKEIEIKGERTDRKVRFQFRCSALVCLALCATLVFGEPGKISKDVKRGAAGQSIDVIVQYRVEPGKSHFDRVTKRGGTLKKDFRGVIRGAA